LGLSKGRKNFFPVGLTSGGQFPIEYSLLGYNIRRFSESWIRKGFAMNVRIEDTCTACGLCVDTCPDVFEMGDDIAQVIVDEVPAEHEDAVQQAADECPSESIIVE
jgi:ferredoxin